MDEIIFCRIWGSRENSSRIKSYRLPFGQILTHGFAKFFRPPIFTRDVVVISAKLTLLESLFSFFSSKSSASSHSTSFYLAYVSIMYWSLGESPRRPT